MREFSQEVLKKRLEQLHEMFNERLTKNPDFNCQCMASAGNLGDCVRRVNRGSESAMDELLSNFERCMGAWARDIHRGNDAEQVYFLSQVRAEMLDRHKDVTRHNVSHLLHLAATRVAILHHEHLLSEQAVGADPATSEQ